MGNQHGKGGEKNLFTSDELKVLEASFRAACDHSDKLRKESLVATWSSIVDAHLAQCTANYLFSGGEQRLQVLTLRQFAEPYYCVERGTIDMKLQLLTGSLESTDENEFAIKALENYVASVFKSYLRIQTEQSPAAFVSWRKYGYQSAERSILGFAKGLIRSITQECDHRVGVGKLDCWLQLNPTFLIIWREVFAYMYSKPADKAHKLHNNSTSNILPVAEGLETTSNYTPIVDLPHVIFINSQLPNGVRHKWRFLFSSKIMGESFSTMLGKIINQGPTLILVEDEDRYIFAGYAPESWALRPNFVGDDTSMLFTLSPAMRCFNATGYNDHFQYLNLNQQTMPNGLGMGGQFQYWGLWLDREYGLGQSSESCTTYRDYVQLSKRKEFRVRNLEAWGIGDLPKADDDDSDEDNGKVGGRSVLDKHLEDRVMLELSGRKMHSDGLREPDLDL